MHWFLSVSIVFVMSRWVSLDVYKRQYEGIHGTGGRHDQLHAGLRAYALFRRGGYVAYAYVQMLLAWIGACLLYTSA